MQSGRRKLILGKATGGGLGYMMWSCSCACARWWLACLRHGRPPVSVPGTGPAAAGTHKTAVRVLYPFSGRTRMYKEDLACRPALWDPNALPHKRTCHAHVTLTCSTDREAGAESRMAVICCSVACFFPPAFCCQDSLAVCSSPCSLHGCAPAWSSILNALDSMFTLSLVWRKEKRPVVRTYG